MKNLKEEYRKMLEGANLDDFDSSSDDIGDEGEIEEIKVKFGLNRKRYF